MKPNAQTQTELLLAASIKRQKHLEGQMRRMAASIEELQARPRSLEDELNSIPGRRIFYNLSAEQDFTVDQNASAGDAMLFQVSQDGAFIMTHYPGAIWKPSAPADATNFGRWRPVSSWPLPTQELGTDIVDLSYRFSDGGSQRNFDNMNVGPYFSRPDALIPLPCPTLFAPNSVINFIPFYERILFNATEEEEDTTAGKLRVTLFGIRIVNL